MFHRSNQEPSAYPEQHDGGGRGICLRLTQHPGLVHEFHLAKQLLDLEDVFRQPSLGDERVHDYSAKPVEEKPVHTAHEQGNSVDE
eukprot:CAMPEP_0184485568 /NCGR_PEP_ID=MMETSP0113_2-20130426/7156_1 /TAXON_ID=91329 /ORGANISM="Norrisiella sphaerica, Strain BC52" /LENGTH=85 /DNA_ID=CAMNT_0026867063 /DNA_START=597 /DNA_END=854 /DNA_ORIENTATION=-